MGKLSDEFLQSTLHVWQPHSSDTLTEEDARQIVENMTGFVTVLAEWEADAKKHTAPAPPKRAESL